MMTFKKIRSWVFGSNTFL